MAHTCIPSIQEAEVGGSGIQRQLQPLETTSKEIEQLTKALKGR